MKLCNRRKFCTITLGCTLISKSAFIPAIAAVNRNTVFIRCLQALCHIIGLILDFLPVIVAKRCQNIISGFFSIYIGLVQSHSCYIQSGTFNFFSSLEFLFKNRMEAVFTGSSNKFTGPWSFSFSSFKKSSSKSLIPFISCHCDPAVITGIWFRANCKSLSCTVQISPLLFPDAIRKICFFTYCNKNVLCSFRYALPHLPGYLRVIQLEAHRICNSVNFYVLNSHNPFPLTQTQIL